MTRRDRLPFDIDPDDSRLHPGVVQDPSRYLQFIHGAMTMSKKDQAALAAKQGTRTAAVKAPEGFTALELNMPSVNWEKLPEVTGEVVDSDIFVTENGAKRVLIVSVGGESMRVYEQPGMRRLFDKVQVGDTVWIKTLGTRPFGKNQSLREFEGAIRPGAKRTPIMQIPMELRRRVGWTDPDADGVTTRS